MCGIAGIWNSSLSPQAASTRLDAMLEAQQHRGPDGRGTLAFPGGAAGMVRLALVDLSERGQQPLWSPDRRVAIVFNGEVYNHAAERARLERTGYPFQSTTDTEVVLALYLEQGLAFAESLRGMFALAIFDFRERGPRAAPDLVLARDPLGIKPLYLQEKAGALAFASELGALKHGALVEPQLDPEGLYDFLHYGFVLQPRTLFRGVRQLEPGTLLHCRPNSRVERTFWSMPAATPRGLPFEEEAKALRGVLDESVRLHALADAPVGAFLSGGIDSSGVVALMVRHVPRLRTYTLRMSSSPDDEAAHACDFARRLGCEHTEVDVSALDLPALVPEFIRGLDQPSTDGFNTWLVSRFAAKDVKGVVSGLGGDEWFNGYPVARRMAALTNAQRLAGGAAERLWRLVPGRAQRRAENLAARSSPLATWAAGHRVFSAGELERLGIRTDRATGPERLFDAIRRPSSGALDLACELDVGAYMRSQLLRDSDVTSMASSLELRVPLVDVEVARFARGTAPSHRVQESAQPPFKRVLVEALHDVLPEGIEKRPKRGFALPQRTWMEGPLRELGREAAEALVRRGMLDRAPEASAYPQAWALLVLEHWLGHHGLA